MKKHILFILLMFPFLLLINCSEDSVSSNEEDHVDTVGLRIVSSGVTIVSYIRDEAVNGKIEVEECTLSGYMDIEFYDDEDEVWVSPGDEHFLLEIEIIDTTIAQYWQHEGEEGGFEFHIRGKEPGHTTVVFKLEHEGHFDFVSKSIEIHVVQGAVTSEETPEKIHQIQESSGDTLASRDNHEGVGSGPLMLTTIMRHDISNESWAFEVKTLTAGSTAFAGKLTEDHGDHNDTVFTTDSFNISV